MRVNKTGANRLAGSVHHFGRLIAGHQAFLDGMLRVGHGASDDDGLVALETRAGEVQHLRCLDIREGPEHLLQLGQVGEAGEAAPGPQ